MSFIQPNQYRISKIKTNNRFLIASLQSDDLPMYLVRLSYWPVKIQKGKPIAKNKVRRSKFWNKPIPKKVIEKVTTAKESKKASKSKRINLLLLGLCLYTNFDITFIKFIRTICCKIY